MPAFEGLTTWAKDRPRLAAGIGGGVVLLLVAVVAFAGGGEDVVPVIDTGAAPVAQGTEAADGTLVAADSTQPTVEAPIEDGASGATNGASVERAPASVADQKAAQSNESSMNAGLSAPPGLTPELGTAPVSSPPITTDDVRFVGQKLEIVADQVDACLAEGTQDVFDCIGKLPDQGFEVIRIYETKPQGARIMVKGAEQVILSFRGDFRCRMLGTSEDCNAWSATSD